MVTSFPKCQKCDLGDLVPLSDFGSQGAAIHFKAWACTNPAAGSTSRSATAIFTSTNRSLTAPCTHPASAHSGDIRQVQAGTPYGRRCLAPAELASNVSH